MTQLYLSDLIDHIKKISTQQDTPGWLNTIYIIGSGPSLRLFPTDFLKDKCTIALNEAYKSLSFKPTVNITIHPRLINNDAGLWLTKNKDGIDIKEYYQFFNTDDLSALLKASAWQAPQSLYVGRGIQTGALALAARLNATYAILCGVDMGIAGCEHHATEANVQFHGISPNKVYLEYYYYTVKVREILESEYGMKTLWLSPMLGIDTQQKDYIHQKKFYRMSDLPRPQEVETAKRVTKLVEDYI